jgi:predicted N-formylglutamate amidohydrolase
MTTAHTPLLDRDEPCPYTVIASSVRSPFFLVCDHAGRALPRSLGSLGVPEEELRRHIAWDVGSARVTRRLAALLESTAVLQTYSRLAIDCNRPLDAPDSIVTESEDTTIPGNRDLTVAERTRRGRAIFEPYHQRIRAELDARDDRQESSVLVAIHSFTPVFRGIGRPWHVGILYNRDARLAAQLLALFRLDETLVVGDNQPYAANELTDYSLVEHGEHRKIACVEIEIRQDLIANDAGQEAWARRFAHALPVALERVQRAS